MILRVMAWVMVQSLKYRNDSIYCEGSLCTDVPPLLEKTTVIHRRPLSRFFPEGGGTSVHRLLRGTPLVAQGRALIRDRALISFFRNNRVFKTKLKDLFKKGQ